MTTNQKHWFALYTKPRSEFNAEKQLQSIGIKNFLPTVTKIRQWSDRKKKVTEPLFRGYIFIYSNEKERLQSLDLTSVVRCIFDNRKPAVIPEWQIENVKKIANIQADLIIHNGIVPGEKVEITSGPLKGVIGTLENTGGKNRLAVSIDILNRSVIVHLTRDSLVKAL